MDEDIRVIESAHTDSSSDFDKVLPLQPTFLGVAPKRLTLQVYKNSWKTVELSNNNEYAQHIYGTIAAGLASEWLANQIDASRFNLHLALTTFIEWLNNYEITQENCYKILKSYESKRTNDDGVKPQSSGLKKIIPALNQGSYNQTLNQKTTIYISELLKCTNISYIGDHIPITLSAFFSSMPWLRHCIDEEDYLKMESPKRLINSFSILISTTLLFIIEAKKQAQLRLKNPSQLQTGNSKNQSIHNSFYSSSLLEKLGSLDKDNQPADDLTRLIIADSVPLIKQTESLSIWISQPGKRIPIEFFVDSHLLNKKYWDKPSTLEQLLFGWLCALQMVQPSDIGKLKHENFVIDKNKYGRPVMLQCKYFKGRSGRIQETPVLGASSIEGMAILAYLDSAKSDLLINEAIDKVYLSNSSTSLTGRLLRLWSDKVLESLIREKMLQRECSFIFLRAYKSMLLDSSETLSSWRHKKRGSIKVYQKTVPKPTPMNLFGLAAIKTSAVHARSDIYREGDLVNQNSHSNQTEKLDYLTDANKDWINQNGRITRAVLLDIERYVYRPNLNLIMQKTHDIVLRTRIISALDTGIKNNNEVRINILGRTDVSKEEIGNLGIDADSIIVLDTPESVINMLHYINEAERQKDTLITNALSFFEQTVVPNVEWMHYVIGQMSSASVQYGEQSYKEIQAVLPPLFSNELRGGITA